MEYLGIHDESMRNVFATYSMVLSCLFGTCFTYYFLEVDLYCPSLQLPLFIQVVFQPLLICASHECDRFPKMGLPAIVMTYLLGRPRRYRR